MIRIPCQLSHWILHAGSQVPSEGSSSGGSGCSRSTSPDVVLLQGDDEDTTVGGEEDAGHSEDEEALSQGTVSLLNISTSDNEDAHKATMHEAACKSDVQYGNWWDEQICQGKEGIAQHDKGFNDYAYGGSPCKAPDKIVSPFSRVLHGRVFVGCSKSAAGTWTLIAKPIGSLIVVFEGSNVLC